MTPFIVAEISKNWINGESETVLLLAQQFERVIEVNRLRGYRLHSFQLHRLFLSRANEFRDDQINETIIAVFERAIVPRETSPPRGGLSVTHDGD